MNKQFCVYILTNICNSVLYTGMTNDLIRRLYEHKNDLFAGFSKRYNLCKLVYFETAENAISAIVREKQIKKLLREEKMDLISSMNKHWHDLCAEIVKCW